MHSMKTIITFLQNLFPESCRGRVFLVGGSVRDALLQRESRDIDLAAALTAEELAPLGFRLVEGKSTAPIWFGYDKAFGKIELTQLPVISGLAEDLARRDFTINAMAMTLGGEVIDPLGGRKELEQRLLRACSPGSFTDDPLRIFRAFRFEADGWRMTSETGTLIRGQEWSRQLAKIPVERFTREMLAALEHPEPEHFFRCMHEFGVGEGWLPELFRMPLVPAGPPEHHPEGDLLTHSLQVLERVKARTDDPLARFCAFFHDIGKLATDPELYPTHHGHDEAGFHLARTFCDRLRLPAAYRTALAWTSRLHGKLNRWAELRDATRVRTAEHALRAGITGILPLVTAADYPAGAEACGNWGEIVRVARMSAEELGIDPLRLKTVAEGKRPAFILHRRVEMLRSLRKS